MAQYFIVTPKDGAVDATHGMPCQRRQFAEQIPVEAILQTEPLGDGEDELAVWHARPGRKTPWPRRRCHVTA